MKKHDTISSKEKDACNPQIEKKLIQVILLET
jgi:hypothetical protein